MNKDIQTKTNELRLAQNDINILNEQLTNFKADKSKCIPDRGEQDISDKIVTAEGKKKRLENEISSLKKEFQAGGLEKAFNKQLAKQNTVQTASNSGSTAPMAKTQPIFNKTVEDKAELEEEEKSTHLLNELNKGNTKNTIEGQLDSGKKIGVYDKNSYNKAIEVLKNGGKENEIRGAQNLVDYCIKWAENR